MAPLASLLRLETLWIQVTGTLCNIACRHCFVSCGPSSELLAVMSAEEVLAAIAEGRALGVREYYFTGGEPFLHPEIHRLIDAALAAGPLTVLTNGMYFDDATCARLRQAFDAAAYSLDLRVSLDGVDPGENDEVRGRGTFEAVTAGLRRLAAHGLNPVITVVEHRAGLAAAAAREAFLTFARELGLTRPRVKFLPLLRLGREERRTRSYAEEERVLALDPGEEERLACGTSRTVTAQGIWPCPILVLDPGARLGSHLAESLGPTPLAARACYTCHVDGLQCRT